MTAPPTPAARKAMGNRWRSAGRSRRAADRSAAPIAARVLAPERRRVWRDVYGVLLQRGERDDFKRPLMSRSQHHVGGRAVFMRPQPVQRRHTPAVAGLESREAVARRRGHQIVADRTLV